MFHLSLLTKGLWILPGFLYAAIACKMALAKSHRTFPWFFRYIVFQTASWAALQAAYYFGTHTQYLYTYCATTMVGAALSFAAIYEIFNSVFRPYDALRDFAGVMFRWAGVVLVLVTVVQAFSTQGTDSRAVMALLILERSISVIACGLLLFILLFSKNLGLDWKNQVVGIALGFGLQAGIELGLWTARIVFHCEFGPTLNMWRAVVFNTTLSIWACYAFLPERKTAEAFAPKLILERWNQVLRGVNRPAPQGAFMPSLERIVDDVMAHQVQGGTVH